MADNKYLKTSEPPAEVQKEAIKPIAKATTKKKGFFRKTKDFLFCGDTRDVKDYIIEETVKPAIKDGLYNIVMDFIDGMIYGSDSSGRRRRKKSGNKYEKGTSYTSYYKNTSKYEEREEKRSRRSSSLDLDNIEFCDPDKSQRENWEDAIDVKAGLINRINRYGTATVQDVADFVGVTSTEWLSIEWGWDDVEEFEDQCIIKKVRGGAIMMLPPPRHLDD